MGYLMAQLTTFQVETERALQEHLKPLGATVQDRKVVGDMEPFVESKVRDLAIWIYADEACVVGRGVERVFEKWDFDRPQDLQGAFIGLVLDLLRSGDEARAL